MTEVKGTARAGQKRIHIIDIIRGILIIYVVYYHFMYDLNDILGYEIDYLYSDWFSAIRDVMSGSLIFISGISCNFSRNNIKRGFKTLGVACVFTLVTCIIMPSQQILFGILHLLGAMMLIYGIGQWLVNKCLKNGNEYCIGRLAVRLLLMIICFGLFMAFFNVYYGYIGIAGIKIPMWSALYGSLPMYFFGFRGPYYSADYYPLLPWGFLFMAGAAGGYIFRLKQLPQILYKNFCRPLSFIGRHTMAIYIVHQPVLFGIFFIISLM